MLEEQDWRPTCDPCRTGGRHAIRAGLEADVLEDQHMSVQQAAVVVADARARARRELVICAPLVYAAWGLTVLLGYGAMWLSVRGQHPYTGPSGGSIAVL